MSWSTNKYTCRSYLEGRVFKRPKLKRRPYFGTEAHLKVNRELPDEIKAAQLVGLFKTYRSKELKKQGYRTMRNTIRRKIGKTAAKRFKRKQQERAVQNAREIQKIALDNAAGAMKVAADIMYDRSAKGSDRLAAVEMVLNRAAGRPTQTNINASIDANATPAEASGKELDERIAETLGRIESLTGRAPKAKRRQKRPINVRIGNRDPGSTNVH